jgi:hypothetical protein
MSNYYAKNPIQMDRQLKVQKLSIPFKIVGSATSANVSITCDEPSLLFFKSQGVDQITAAVPSGETATYSSSLSDSGGVVQVLVLIQEPVNKIVSCHGHDLVNGNLQKFTRGSTSGVTSPASGNNEGTAIMLTLTTSQAINAANTVDSCLELEYVVDNHN